jgi:hypothetical protein
VRPRLAAIKVSGGHLILVICVAVRLSDLEQVEAERLDLGQYAVQRGLVEQAGEHACAPRRRGAIAGNADSTVAPCAQDNP